MLQIQVGVELGVIADYMNAFGQDFTFAPDPLDAAQLPGAFDGWSYAVEEKVMRGVLAECLTRSVSFVGVDSTVVSDREVVLIEDYTLIVGPDRYHGEARLYMAKDVLGDWRIHVWSDLRSASDPDTTWGVLKGLQRSKSPRAPNRRRVSY